MRKDKAVRALTTLNRVMNSTILEYKSANGRIITGSVRICQYQSMFDSVYKTQWYWGISGSSSRLTSRYDYRIVSDKRDSRVIGYTFFNNLAVLDILQLENDKYVFNESNYLAACEKYNLKF